MVVAVGYSSSANPILLADDARETRIRYHAQQTSTSTEAISDAAYQVALATQALVAEGRRFAEIRGTAFRQPPGPLQVPDFSADHVTSQQAEMTSRFPILVVES